ncbi:MAG: hypothetical protein GF411_16910 [Candidatus Lokiarchaeota archaeon]|nr:hypothetical protein [Candidatus Lokiarchaeota archaeon]
MSKKNGNPLLKVKLSKVVFPEICPVCLAEAEDLVSMQVWSSEDKQLASTTFSGSADKTESLLHAKKGATVIWVPTCMRHGSKAVRTTGKIIKAWIAFLILWYPGIYFLLGVLSAYYNDRPILPPLFPLLVIFLLMVISLLYGYYPRTLERKLKFVDVDRLDDALFIKIRSPEYYEIFFELNELYVEIIDPLEETED